jgi:predicted flap endonuclease-1-like 5' DNA nuclease
MAAVAAKSNAPAAHPVLPSAMGSSGPATVTASVTPAPAAPPRPAVSVAAATVDDLTRIRAIDGALHSALNGMGVRSFADIAAWKPDDVTRIANSLNVPGRIEQENWIEQAQILAKGGETYYSRRKSKGEQPSAKPTPDEGDRITIRVPAATRPMETPAVATPVAPVPVAPIPAVVAAPVAVTAPPSTAEIKAAAAAAAAAVQAAQAAVAPAAAAAVVAVAAKAAAALAPAPVVAVPAAQAGATDAAPAAGAVGNTRDALQRIAGINTEVEKLLNVQGVTRYSQIANWSASDTSRFDRLLGFEGRIARENWIEQANILAKGGETAFARDQARKAAEPVLPAKLADALQGAKPAAAEAAPRAELANLRSVKSEAYRGSEAAAGAGRPADDLKRIRGVGVLIEKKLNALGVSRYDQVANWTQPDIERFSDKLDFKGRIERENWVEQARILSAGGQTEFSQRVDRGEVESSKPG